MHPSWPESSIGLCLIVYSLIKYSYNVGQIDHHPGRDAGLTIFITLPFAAIYTIWLISFAFVEAEKATGGWISVMLSVTAAVLFWTAISVRSQLILLLVGLFLTVASWAVIIQRWNGDIGTVAYEITNSHGCEPYDGFQYLQQGVRSRAFTIIQTVEAAFVLVVIIIVRVVQVVQVRYARHLGPRHGFLQYASGGLLLQIYGSVIAYEGLIATKGAPIVISGNCMLVELNPRFGFFGF